MPFPFIQTGLWQCLQEHLRRICGVGNGSRGWRIRQCCPASSSWNPLARNEGADPGGEFTVEFQLLQMRWTDCVGSRSVPTRSMLGAQLGCRPLCKPVNCSNTGQRLLCQSVWNKWKKPYWTKILKHLPNSLWRFSVEYMYFITPSLNGIKCITLNFLQDSNQFHAVCMDTHPPISYMTDISHKIVRMVHAVNSHFKRNVVCIDSCLSYELTTLAVSKTDAFSTGRLHFWCWS